MTEKETLDDAAFTDRIAARSCRRRHGFTLIEIILAMSAAAMILAAIYGIFSKAIHMRNNATERTRDSRIRARAAATLRNDLKNAIVSGGVMAAYLQGSNDTHGSSFPGYLTFTTTTARDPNVDEVNGDVQQVEYFVANDPDANGGAVKAGLLVRTADKNILATTRDTNLPPETLLSGVQALEVSFYNGQTWATTWTFSTDTNPTLPEAVKVIVRMAPTSPNGGGAPAPIEVLVPWSVQPEIDLTPTQNP